MNFAYFSAVKTGQANALATISAKLDDPDLTMSDFALMVKAVELIENIQDMASFHDLVLKVSQKAASFYAPTLSGEDVLMLTRAAKLCDLPCGCLLYTSPSPRDGLLSRMPSSA